MNTFLHTVVLLLVFALSAFAAESSPTDKDVATLQTASFFSVGGVGVAGTTSSEEDAFRTILKQPDGPAKFQRLLTTATLPGQMYALLGLHQLDKSAFEAAASKYQSRTEPVKMMIGCVGGAITPKEFVKAVQAGQIR